MAKPANKHMTQFHPLIRQWFAKEVGRPTEIQTLAWPVIAAGKHALISAPTGSGKTLTAFLSAISEFASGRLPTGCCSVLYVSPLKALNNDIQRNLLTPLQQLKRVFVDNGEPFPDINVMTRSGDTPQSERRRIQRHPPEILITTPESLNLMLSSAGGIQPLSHLRTVILDEIHGVIDNKRGTHLISAVERLVRLCGEFQRIALSATVRPMDLVARFIGGFERVSDDYRPRHVKQLSSSSRKAYDIQVCAPTKVESDDDPGSFWHPLIHDFKKIIDCNRSTLLFTNSRRMAETITLKINLDQPEPHAYAHHGSLSREIRAEVERKMKAGELKAIVATNSLEMGIDIGALDEVVLVQTPNSISSTVQRVGRAGHRVGETSRARIFPTAAQEFVEAAVLADGIKAHEIEEAHTIRNPLDVLAQIIVSMTAVECWHIDELYAEIRRSYAFHELPRGHFDLVLTMLSGRYANTRVPELKARISIDRIDNTVSARKGAVLDLYMNGGTIPDRGYFRMRHLETGALIGELDEEFVWEASIGQTTTFGTQNWRIEKITHNDVFVLPGNPSSKQTPFWKGEALNRDAHFSQRIGAFLQAAEQRIDDKDFAEDLSSHYSLNALATEELLQLLKDQREACNGTLPHRHNIVVEFVQTGPGGHPGNQIIIHTIWGGRVNHPFGLALKAAWRKRFGEGIEVFPSNDAVYIMMPPDVEAAELLSLVTTSNLESLLRSELENSGFFGARFRECAGRALLISRKRMSERMPLWVSRLRSQKLLEAVSTFDDFPILLEAWRTCLQDEFDVPALMQMLGELESGESGWTEVHRPSPSPFAKTMTWWQINQYMYEDDTPRGTSKSKLSNDLLRDIVSMPGLRPVLTPEIVERFEKKRQRLEPGYAPQTARDLLDWVKERVLIPVGEWKELLQAVERDHELDEETLLRGNAGKLVALHPANADPLVVAVETLPRLDALWPEATLIPLCGDVNPPSGIEADEVRTILNEWLRFYGPRSEDFVLDTLGLEAYTARDALEDLLDTDELIRGQLVDEGPDDAICVTANFEALLRLQRRETAPEFKTLPPEELPLFLASHQGLCRNGDPEEDLTSALEQLSGVELQAPLWEEDVLPSRVKPYAPRLLDMAFQEDEFVWFGGDGKRISICLHDDLPLLRDDAAPPTGAVRDLLPDSHARYSLQALSERSGQSMEQLVTELWRGVWDGNVSNDSFAALRQGIMNKFKPPTLPKQSRQRRGRGRGGRRAFSRWSGALPSSGNWYRMRSAEPVEDLLEREELGKDRVRLLLDRHGILFRELLQRERPELQWPSIFRSLRIMELSGEVFAGCFFHGIPGLQFMSHRGFRSLQRELPKNASWWVNAVDPASLCGIGLDAFRGSLPRRVPGNYVVYRGCEIIASIQRNGKDLRLLLEPNDRELQAAFCVLDHLLGRRFQPLRQITVETINDERADESAYLDALRGSFSVVKDFQKVQLARKLV